VSLALWRSLSSWMKLYSARKFVTVSAPDLVSRNSSMISFRSCHFPSLSNPRISFMTDVFTSFNP